MLDLSESGHVLVEGLALQVPLFVISLIFHVLEGVTQTGCDLAVGEVVAFGQRDGYFPEERREHVLFALFKSVMSGDLSILIMYFIKCIIFYCDSSTLLLDGVVVIKIYSVQASLVDLKENDLASVVLSCFRKRQNISLNCVEDYRVDFFFRLGKDLVLDVA